MGGDLESQGCVREVIAYCKERQDKKVIQATGLVLNSMKDN